MFRKWLFFLFFALIALSSGKSFAGNDHITQRGYFEDATGNLTIEHVQGKGFTPYIGVLNKGYSSSVFWIRLGTLPNNSLNSRILRIEPSYLDDVAVFQNINGSWLETVVGDTHPYAERERPETSLNVVINPHAASDIYVRLKTNSTNLIGFDLLDENQFIAVETQKDLLVGICCGAILFILLWFVYRAIKTKDGLTFEVCFFLLINLYYLLSVFGFTARYFFPTQPQIVDVSTSLAIIGMVVLTALFHFLFIRQQKCLTYHKVMFGGFFFASLVSIGLFLLGYVRYALELNAALVLFLSVVCFLIFISYVLNRSLFDRKIAWTYLLFGILLSWTMIPILGYIKADNINLYANTYVGFMSALLLSFLMRDRVLLKERQANEAINVAQLAKKEAQMERMRRDEQNKLLMMLTHEIKTPLSVLKIVLDEHGQNLAEVAPANRAIKNIDAIINRCLTLDKVDSESIQVYKTSFVIGDLIDQAIVSLSALRVDKAGDCSNVISTDWDLLYVVVRNLIENALKYSPSDSPITLIVKSDSDGVMISLTNQIGHMGAPDARHVFEKYYRYPGATRISGSGLGLYLVKSILSLLGGTINYSVTPDEVHFQIWLPR